jgi:hypothetical protein
MGGVAPRITWCREYTGLVDGWRQNFQASVDQTRRRLIVVSELWCEEKLPPGHPFRPLLGVKIGQLDAQDLWYVLAEVERPLKPRWKFFWLEFGYRFAIREIIPSEPQSNLRIGLVIASPAEQQKLSKLFREALTLVEEAD